jgi:hypothetical protein
MEFARASKTRLLSAILPLATVIFPGSACAMKPEAGAVGMNLSVLDSASTQIPFVDVFKQSNGFRIEKKWIPADAKPASPAAPSAIDKNGWVASLAYDEQAIACVFNNNLGRFPAGTYNVFYDGDGELIFYGATTRNKMPGRIEIDVNPDKIKGWKYLCVVETKTNPNNPIRNIRIILPGFENNYEKDVWYPPFIERLRPFKAIRFMDWELTNLNIDVEWSDRRQPDHATQASPIEWRTFKGQGVALEYQIDLANKVGADPWFNIPATASDDYIRQMARLVREKLRPNLHPMIELSNEVFNNFPASYDYALEMGERLGLSAPPGDSVVFSWYALRVSQMFDIWNDVYGADANKIVHIVTGRRISPSVNEYLLQYNELYKKTDVLAIDGYVFPFNKWEPPLKNGKLKWSDVAAMSTDKVLHAMHDYIDARLVPSWNEAARVAKKYGVSLVVYEGGESNVTSFQTEDARVTNLFVSTSRDPNIAEVYAHLLSAWNNIEGASLFSQYNFVGMPNKFGCWGALEYQDQDIKSAPKYSALVAYSRGRGVHSGAPHSASDPGESSKAPDPSSKP